MRYLLKSLYKTRVNVLFTGVRTCATSQTSASTVRVPLKEPLVEPSQGPQDDEASHLEASITGNSAAAVQEHADAEKHTHFGFTTVKEDEKAKKVHEVFETVADNYDLMNDVMSAGVHRIWKDIFIDRLGPTKGTQLLDVAGGTGDIAFRFLNYTKSTPFASTCQVTVCDINKPMLKVGEERCKRDGHDAARIKWVTGNAEELPFEDGAFNAYTIAFGIRNVTHVDVALREAYRVLRPGGRFMCLEFSQLEYSMAQWLYDQYSFQVIPVMGQVFAGQWKPYQYLVESIRQFPDQESFKNMIEEAGFRQVSYENLALGVVAIHSGFKI